MDKNTPLDFMLVENVISRPVFSRLSESESDPFDFENDIPEAEEGTLSDEAHEEHEESETPAEEELEHSEDPRDVISELQRKISDLKAEITDKLKPLFPEDKDKNVAEALDDATSALDLACHHLTDVDNDESGSEAGTEELEDQSTGGGEEVTLNFADESGENGVDVPVEFNNEPV